MENATRNAKRELRVGWARGRTLLLTARDLSILYAVGVMRAPRTSDLTALFFHSVEPARDRLRRLYVGGFLDCHAPLVNAENHYTLTRRGREAVLSVRDEIDAESLVCAKGLPARLAHLTLTNRARVLFTLATRQPSPPYRLVAFRSEWELVRAGSPALYGILPDAIATLERVADGAHVEIAIEADTGSESPTVIASKARRYLHYTRSGQLLYGASVRSVVVLAPGLRRSRALARAVATIDPNAPVRFGDALTLLPADVFGGGLLSIDRLLADRSTAP